jgi:hypothetical protein
MKKSDLNEPLLPEREEQIALIDSAETRTADYLRKWLRVPAFKAALHRHDRAGTRGLFG